MATTNPGTQEADVLAIFGITGDLARVMTFRSLYRLEARGLLKCPIVGVAVDDWTLDQLGPARAGLHRGDRREAGRKGVPALLGAALIRARRLLGRGDVRARGARQSRARSRPCSTWRSRRSCSARVVQGLKQAGLTDNARIVVEKPFGHDRASARALAAELHQYVDESQMFRIDHFLGKMGFEEILYLRFANTMLEPVWNRNYVDVCADHDGRGLRRRRPRPLLRPGRGAARRGGQPPHAGRGCARRWSRRPGGDPATLKDAQTGAVPGDRRRPIPANYVRGQYDGLSRYDGVAREVHDGDVCCAAARHRQLALVRRAVLHPHRQALAGHPNRGPARIQAPAAPRIRELQRPKTEPNQIVVKLDPSTGHPSHPGRTAGATRRSRQPIMLDMEFADEGGEGATPYEVLLSRGDGRASHALHAAGRRRGDVADHAAPARCAAAGTPYAAGSWGPPKRERAGRGPRRLARSRGS